jgi:hypothetical protein
MFVAAQHAGRSVPDWLKRARGKRDAAHMHSDFGSGRAVHVQPHYKGAREPSTPVARGYELFWCREPSTHHPMRASLSTDSASSGMEIALVALLQYCNDVSADTLRRHTKRKSGGRYNGPRDLNGAVDTNASTTKLSQRIQVLPLVLLEPSPSIG